MDISISLNGAGINLTPEQTQKVESFVKALLFNGKVRKVQHKVLGSRKWKLRELRAVKRLREANNGRVSKDAIKALAQKLGRTPSAVINKLSKAK